MKQKADRWKIGMGSAQALNAAWLASKMHDYKRPVALAGYVMSIQCAGFAGQQLFRQQGKRKITHSPMLLYPTWDKLG